MKILYRQTPEYQSEDQDPSAFCRFGIKNCYFKSINQSEQDGSSTKKRHSHTGYEFHILIDGQQTYETCDGDFSVKGGCFLAIPKGRTHRLLSADYPVKKYAITFSLDQEGKETFCMPEDEKCLCLPIPERAPSNFQAIAQHSRRNCPSSAQIVENCVFESVILLLREIGIVEYSMKPLGATERNSDERVALARQFISDNIETPLQVSEVALYCYISEKQLTRLFYASEKMSLADYIRRQRVRHIEELLRMPDISLFEISRRMGFPNESGFNAFFKKNNGMPPGEYRKMITNGKN